MKDRLLPTLPGAKYRDRQTSANAILPAGTKDWRKVYSSGTEFYNVDKWTSLFFVQEMLKWAKDNPNKTPSKAVIRRLANTANSTPLSPGRGLPGSAGYQTKPFIHVAHTPDRLSIHTHMAIVGGVYHECWHTKYSCRRNVTNGEVGEIISRHWSKVPDWSKYSNMLLSMNNIIEDIRIEQIGISEYPGTSAKMHDLQDFILDLEAESREKNPKVAGNSFSILTCAFRDLGFGYKTSKGQDAFRSYRDLNPQALALVEKGGPLYYLVQKAKSLTKQDDLGSLNLAMEFIVEVHRLSQGEFQDQNQQNQQQNKSCPSCGAGRAQLSSSPAKNDKGNALPGKTETECDTCGHKETQDSSQGSGSGQDSGNGSDQDSDQGSGSGQDSDQGNGSDQNPDQDSGSGNGSDQGSGSGQDSDQGSGSGQDSDQDSGQGNGSIQEDFLGYKSAKAQYTGHTGSSGGVASNQKTEQSFFADTLKEAIRQAQAEIGGALDWSDALSSAVEDTVKEDLKEAAYGEQPYRPTTTDFDTIAFVQPSHKGKEADDRLARDMLDSVREESAFLRARLRNMVRAAEMRGTLHGVRKGKKLSGKRLVNTRIQMLANKDPNRAYKRKDDTIDTSIAASVVLDQSGSMYYILGEVSRALVALVEPLDALGAKVQVTGFRNSANYDSPNMSDGTAHRKSGEIINHDVFMAFGERFHNVRYRFANTRATGTTPTSDGIALGLDALSNRNEGHRIMFVITDGVPDSNHSKVVRWQIRKAAEAGVHVIGIGIGNESQYVKSLFPTHIHVNKVKDLPNQIIRLLNNILDFNGFGKSAALRGSNIQTRG